MPLAYAQLGQPADLDGLPSWNLVKAQQQNIKIPKATMIQTADLPMDGIHFTVDSYKVIGQRFAGAINSIQAAQAEGFANPNGESPPVESVQ